MATLHKYTPESGKLHELRMAVQETLAKDAERYTESEREILEWWLGDEIVRDYQGKLNTSLSYDFDSVIQSTKTILSTKDNFQEYKRTVFMVCSYVLFSCYNNRDGIPFTTDFYKKVESSRSKIDNDVYQSVQLGIQRWNLDYISYSNNILKECSLKCNENIETVKKLSASFEEVARGADEVENIYNSIKDVKAHYAISKLSVDFKGLLDGLERKASNQGWSAAVVACIVFTLLLTKIFIQFDFVDMYITRLPCMPNDGGLFWSIVSLVHGNIMKVSNIATEIAVIVMLVYFFRILMSQYNATNEQIVEYRHIASVCDFTSSYVPFLKENKLSSDDALQKFNKYIFATRSKSNPQLPEAIWCGLVPGTVNPNGNAGNKADQL